jgi:orotate phosphoribosyltransferase-like protein
VIPLTKITKEETMKVMKLLKDRGFTYTEIASKLNVSSQTIYCWSALSQADRVPKPIYFEALKQLTEED